MRRASSCGFAVRIAPYGAAASSPYASSATSGSALSRWGTMSATRVRQSSALISCGRLPAASLRSQPDCSVPIAPRTTQAGNGSVRTSSSGLPFGAVAAAAGPFRGYPPSIVLLEGGSPRTTSMTRNRLASAVGTASTACSAEARSCALVAWPAPRQMGHAAAVALTHSSATASHSFVALRVGSPDGPRLADRPAQLLLRVGKPRLHSRLRLLQRLGWPPPR